MTSAPFTQLYVQARHSTGEREHYAVLYVRDPVVIGLILNKQALTNAALEHGFV